MPHLDVVYCGRPYIYYIQIIMHPFGSGMRAVGGGGGHVCVPLRRKEVNPRQRMKTLHMMVNGIIYHIWHNIPHLQYSPPQLNPTLNSLHRACMRDGNVWLPPLRLATKMTVVAFFVTTQVSWSLRVSIAISCYKIFKYNAYMQYM